MYRQVIAAIGRTQGEVARLQLQVATGRRILAPSDDPFGATRSLEINNALAQLTQFQENSARARQRLSLEDQALGQVIDALQRVNELAVQANNDTQTDETRAFIASELTELRDRIVALANASDGEGGYIFSGNRTETQPFSYASTGVSYLGDQGQRMLLIGPGRQLPDGDSGSDVFLEIPSGNGTFATSAAGANTGTGIIDAGSVVDPTLWDGDTYTITFTTATDYEVRDSANALVTSGTLPPDGDQVIQFRGVSVELNGAPAAGDAFVVEPSTNKDIFSTLQDFIDTMLLGAVDDTAETRLHNSMNGVLANVDQAFRHLSHVQARTGTRLNAIDDQDDMNVQYSILLQGTAAEIDNVDLTQAISELDLKLTSLQASEQAFVAVQRLSLFNYL
jgi:flagellar hook-associated protein 3 FlgL